MIYGRTFTGTEKILHEMQNSNIHFYLTGSRYFGGWNNESDWDFFVESSPDAISWLIKNNFELDLESSDYRDNNTLAVYKHKKWDIHIQVSQDAALKAQVQSAIYEKFLTTYRNMSKNTRNFFWEDMFRIHKKVEVPSCEAI